MPAVYPRVRGRLRATAIALCVSSSLTLGLAPSLTGSANAAETRVVGHSATSSAQLLSRHEPAKKPAHKVAVHKAAKHKVVKHKVAKHKVVKKAHKKVVYKKKAKIAFGTRVIREASRFRGTPYRWGATGPSRFDCSGFTRFVFAKFGVSLPHSSSGQYSMVRHVANGQKRVGDLVFFHTGGGHVYHVGIYAGGDRIWAATHTGDFVRLEGMWSASYYVGRIT